MSALTSNVLIRYSKHMVLCYDLVYSFQPDVYTQLALTTAVTAITVAALEQGSQAIAAVMTAATVAMLLHLQQLQ
jgi:hypothetical protein